MTGFKKRQPSMAALRAVTAEDRDSANRGVWHPPRFPPDLVKRDMASWLEVLAEHEVLSVRAPPGYGKSAWCAALFAEAVGANWQAVWFDCEQFDADSLVEAVAMLTLPGINSGHRLIVLDAFDCLPESAASGIIEHLFDNKGSTNRLVIATRHPVPFDIAGAKRRGTLVEVNRVELALSDEELRGFLARKGLAVDLGAARDLNRTLCGWPLAARAVAGQLAGGETMTARTPAPLAEILKPLFADWFGALSEDDLALLTDCSVGPWVDCALAGQLTGTEDAAGMLDGVAQAGIWIDRRGARFVYHPALRAVLGTQLGERDPRRLARLRALALQHYILSGDSASAVDMAVARGDRPLAQRLIAGLAKEMVERGDFARLAEWLDFAGADCDDYPELAEARRWLAVFLPGRLPIDAGEAGKIGLIEASFALDRPQQAFESLERLLARREELPQFTRDMVLATIADSAVRRGLFGLVHNTAREVLLHRKERLDLPVAIALRARALTARAQGQLAEAERILREAKSLPTTDGIASALVDASLARACYEREAFDMAVALAAQALPQLEDSAFQHALIDCYHVTIRIAEFRGDRDAAASMVDGAELIAFGRDWLPLKAFCAVERARLCLQPTIDPESIVAAEDEAGAIVDPLGADARAFALLAELRAYDAIAQGDRPRLTAMAANLLVLASNADNVELRTLATLFNILPQLSGRCDRMVELETVRFLNQAAASGFCRSIQDVLTVSGVRAVQNFCNEAYSSDSFLAFLKQSDPPPRSPVLPGSLSAIPHEAFSFLTEREIDILTALSEGQSNKEIARSLDLAPETIKWHLKNIMRKLRATTREEAVANAATLGLTLDS